MGIFTSPSAHNIKVVTAHANCFGAPADPLQFSDKPFATLTLNMEAANGEVGFFQIFGDFDMAPKFRAAAEAINAAFAEPTSEEKAA